MDVYFGIGYNLTIEDPKFKRVKDANYRFVVEKLKLPSGQKEYDCLANASPSLRRLITSCKGSLRVREMTVAEMVQAQKYKFNFMGNRLSDAFSRKFSSFR